MVLSDDQKNLCAEWVAAPNRKWQTLNRSQWKYQFHEKTLVRYVEEAKMDEDIVPLLLEYLVSDDCKRTLQLYGQGVSGDWTPIKAWYEPSNKSVGSVRSVRLYHALSTDVNGADGPYIVENGCAYKVEWTYYWKCPTVQTVPASTSGVSYHITNLQRDPETGLFSYAIEKRERVQQDIAEYLTSRTTYQDTKEEVHLGVKGAESAGGKPASVANGRTVTRKVTKNSDCTHDVHNVTTEDKAVSSASVAKTETLFETRTTTEHRNQPSAANMSLSPGSSAKDEKTPTDLHNQTLSQTVEKPVSNASVEFVKTLHGTQKSVTHRNQRQPLSGDGMKIGERRSTRKTDGGNNDNTQVTMTVEPAGMIEKSERKTVFASSSSTRENVAANGVLPERETKDAADGVTHGKEVRLHDDGTADIVSTDTTENAVASAAVEIRRSLRGIEKTVTDRSQPTALSESDMAIGERRATRKTDGGRNDNTRTTVKAAPVGATARSCQKTVYEERRQMTSIVAANGLPPIDVGSAADGKVRRREARRNEDGVTADIVDAEVVEKPVADAEETKRRTLRGVVKRTVKRNQQGKDTTEPELGKQVTNRKTDGGVWDIVREEVKVDTKSNPVSESATEDKFSKTTVKEEVLSSFASPVGDVSFSVGGSIKHVKSSKHDDSSVDKVTRTVVPKSSMKRKAWSDDFGRYERCEYHNQREPLLPQYEKDAKVSVSFRENKFGLLDGAWTTSISGNNNNKQSITKTYDKTEEDVVKIVRKGKSSKLEYYRTRRIKNVLRYDTLNQNWRLAAEMDIREHPGDAERPSRVIANHMWEYWIINDWDIKIKKRYIM